VLASIAVVAAVVIILQDEEAPEPPSSAPYVPPEIEPETDPETGAVRVPVDKRPTISITSNGVPLENNSKPYYLERPTGTKPGESITFNIKITNPGDFTTQEIMRIDDMLYAYNPYERKFYQYRESSSNLFPFDVELRKETDDTIKLVITKNGRLEVIIGDGKIPFILYFGKFVIINDEKEKGFIINDKGELAESEIQQGHLFLLNFTVLKP